MIARMEGSKNGGNEAADSVGNYLRRRQLGASRGGEDNTGRALRTFSCSRPRSSRMPHRFKTLPPCAAFDGLPRLRKRPEISAAAFSFIMHGLSFVRYRVTDRPLIRRESPSTTAVFDVLWRHILSQGALQGGEPRCGFRLKGISMFVITILSHTPIWVWVLLAFLISRGIMALRPREVRRAESSSFP